MKRFITLGSFFVILAIQLACSGSEGPAVSETAAAPGTALAALPSSTAVLANNNEVMAYQPDGRKAWSFALPDNDTIAAPPVAALSSVTYVRGRQGLYAIAPDGKALWQAKHQGANDGLQGITPLSDSTVAITQEDRSLVGYSAQGQPKWTYNLPEGEKIVAAPVLAASSIVYLRTAKSVYAVDSQGNLAWVAEVGADAVR